MATLAMRSIAGRQEGVRSAGKIPEILKHETVYWDFMGMSIGHAILASPVSSFSLTTRPMVLAPSDIIEVRVDSQHEQAGLTLDGQVMVRLHDTDVVRGTRAEFTCKFIVFAENSFYKVLKNKLHWGFTPSG